MDMYKTREEALEAVSPLCKDCVHYLGNDVLWAKCKRTLQYKAEPVEGDVFKIYSDCEDEREGNKKGRCGISGEFFEFNPESLKAPSWFDKLIAIFK